MATRTPTKAICGFNPRPPRKVGATWLRTPFRPLDPVSILAHPERWALRTCLLRSVLSTTNCRFNPRPPRKVGATVDARPTPVNIVPSIEVSILAHPERWALPVVGHRTQSHDHCFNPRPPRKVGATAGSIRDGLGTVVSILAHPERWALQRQRILRDLISNVSILAHPERWALLPLGVDSLGIQEFQSSPTPKGGRYNGCC